MDTMPLIQRTEKNVNFEKRAFLVKVVNRSIYTRYMRICRMVITPRVCTRGKAIGLSVCWQHFICSPAYDTLILSTTIIKRMW